LYFKDRRDAGQKLADALTRFKDRDPLILAIPRGGVVVAAEVAARLDARLDVIVPRKIGSPGNPEYAMGAVGPDGGAILDRETLRYLGLSEDAGEVARAVEEARGEMRRRLRSYRGDRPEPDLSGKTVVVIDDGIATGLTARAALRSVRRAAPGRTVLAVPVAPPNRIPALRAEADEVVCLVQPTPFYAVGQFYERFDQTSDEEVRSLLDRLGPPAPNRRPPRRQH